MVFLLLFILIDMCLVAHFEHREEKGFADVNRMIQEAKYHEAHPEQKRSVKYMTAGYYIK